MSIPGAKTKRGLANPPILTTDMGQVKGPDMTRNHILGAVRIPNGFLDRKYARGVAAMWQLEQGTNSWDDEFNAYGLAVHAPTQDVTQYATGWKTVDGSIDGPAGGGVMGAQRRGQYVYAITNTFLTAGGAATYQFVDRFHGVYAAERRHHDKAFGYMGLGGAASGQPTPSLVIQANSELFVSDHEFPRLWFLSGSTCGRIIDDDTTWAWHWESNDNRGFGGGDESLPYYGQQRFKFGYWHYYQDYKKPSKKWMEPTLVHPWRVGNYDPPEMWWFKPERTSTGEYTQRIKIYRAQWGKGNYRADRGWITLGAHYVAHPSTPPGLVGQFVPGSAELSDVSTNVDGEAFEHDFHDEEHYVGVVGPFRSAVFTDLGESIFGANRIIKVIRDPRRRGRLILGMFQQGSILGQGWDGAWFATSHNDGATWGRARQMNPFAQGAHGMQVDAYQAMPAMLMTTGGDLLVPAAASYGEKASHSFAVVNFAAAVTNRPEQERTVWRRGAGGDQ